MAKFYDGAYTSIPNYYHEQIAEAPQKHTNDVRYHRVQFDASPDTQGAHH